MRVDEYLEYDATALAELIRSGEVSALEVTEASLSRISETNPALNAVIGMREPQVREEIASGLPEGPLHGVPYLIKDLRMDLLDVPTTHGSRLFADNYPESESEYVARIRRAGTALLGKTNVPEFGIVSSTEGGFLGPCRNPWNPKHGSGGSSGGAAAAVAAGMVPAAHASDGGGSTRIPSSLCGVFGMKPTRARTPFGPGVYDSRLGMGVHHAVSRSVRDSALLLDITAGPYPGDPYYAPPPARPFLEEVGAPPGRLRVGVILELMDDEVPVHPEARGTALAAAKLMEDLGHHVEALSWPRLPSPPRPPWGIIGPDLATKIDARLEQLGRSLRSEDLDPFTASIYEKGKTTLGIDFQKSIKHMHELSLAIAAMMGPYDVILTPTTAAPAPELGLLTSTKLPEGDYWHLRTQMNGFTSVFNLTGNPAMSVPLYMTESGLPIGTQFAAKYADEATLFRLAAQLEEALPWATRRPHLGKSDGLGTLP